MYARFARVGTFPCGIGAPVNHGLLKGWGVGGVSLARPICRPAPARRRIVPGCFHISIHGPFRTDINQSYNRGKSTFFRSIDIRPNTHTHTYTPLQASKQHPCLVVLVGRPFQSGDSLLLCINPFNFTARSVCGLFFVYLSEMAA